MSLLFNTTEKLARGTWESVLNAAQVKTYHIDSLSATEMVVSVGYVKIMVRDLLTMHPQARGYRLGTVFHLWTAAEKLTAGNVRDVQAVIANVGSYLGVTNLMVLTEGMIIHQAFGNVGWIPLGRNTYSDTAWWMASNVGWKGVEVADPIQSIITGAREFIKRGGTKKDVLFKVEQGIIQALDGHRRGGG